MLEVSTGVSVERRTILNDLIQMQQEIVDCKEKEEAKKKEAEANSGDWAAA